MFGTIQSNCTGAPTRASLNLKANTTKKWMYEYRRWQHNDIQPSVAAVWSDNGIIKILSNYHQPIIIARWWNQAQGRKMTDGVRDQHRKKGIVFLRIKIYLEHTTRTKFELKNANTSSTTMVWTWNDKLAVNSWSLLPHIWIVRIRMIARVYGWPLY